MRVTGLVHQWCGSTGQETGQCAYSMVNSPPWQSCSLVMTGRSLGFAGILTDNTLSREVLPAFWSPIMVTSISVALLVSVSACGDVSRPSWPSALATDWSGSPQATRIRAGGLRHRRTKKS